MGLPQPLRPRCQPPADKERKPGEALNERTNYYHKPQVNFNHYWTVNDRLSVSIVMYASYGTGGGTASTGGVSVPTTGQVNFQGAYPGNVVNFDKVGGVPDYKKEWEVSRPVGCELRVSITS